MEIPVNDRMTLFRTRTRTRLAYLGVTFADLARELGISRQSLQGWITGEDIKLGHVERVADALAVPTRFLVDPRADAWPDLTTAPPDWPAAIAKDRGK